MKQIRILKCLQFSSLLFNAHERKYWRSGGVRVEGAILLSVRHEILTAVSIKIVVFGNI